MERVLAADAALIVLEHGAPWPSRFVRDAPPAVAAFRQERDEAMHTLAARMRHGLRQLEEAGASVARAAYAVSGDGDLAARAVVARDICSILGRSTAPVRLLTIASSSAADGHRTMFGILDALAPSVASLGIRLAVQVEHGAPPVHRHDAAFAPWLGRSERRGQPKAPVAAAFPWNA
jgi:hypothetical protein